MLGAQPAISQSRAEAEEGQEPSGFPVALLQAVQRQREEVLWKKEKAEWLDWSAATATAQGPSTWQHSPAQLAQLSPWAGPRCRAVCLGAAENRVVYRGV